MKKILIALLLCVMTSFAYGNSADTVYAVDMQTLVKDMLGGTNTGNLYTTAMIRSQLNLNCREYASIIGIPAEDTIVTLADSTDYTLNSDFWTIKGVVKLHDGRKKMIRQKGVAEKSPYTKGIGEEEVDVNTVLYYTIKSGLDTITSMSRDVDTTLINADAIYRLTLDRVSSVAGADTLIVSYNAQASELLGDSSITNIPYGGVPVVVYGTVLNCMIMNRENAFVQFLLPIVEKKYTQVFNALKSQEASSFDYDPSKKPPSQ
jgi:hypothetical protein